MVYSFLNISVKIYSVKNSPGPLYSKQKKQYLAIIWSNPIEFLQFELCFLLLGPEFISAVYV